MKRYLLFRGKDYYPSGGMEDFHSESDCVLVLLEFILQLETCEWTHIYDTELKKIIYFSESIGKYPDYKYVWIKDEIDDAKV